MKKIYPILVLFFGFDAYAARTPFGEAMEAYKNTSGYLVDVADAWASVSLGMGPSGSVAKKMSDTYNSDLPTFHDIMSVVAYNETSLIMFEAMQHVDASFLDINAPLNSRRTVCMWEDGKCNFEKKSLIIDGRVFGHVSSFNSKLNGHFDTQTGGMSIAAKGYVSEGMLVGIAYTRSMTDTKDNRIYTDTISNSVTAFGQYLSKGGAFVNGGVTLGSTAWTTDKSAAGIQTPQDYDSNFLAGYVTSGVKVERGPVFFIPQIGLRYTHLNTDKHTDVIVQTFKEWSHDTLSAMGGVRLGTEFLGSDFSFRPSVLLAGSYDVLSDGDDNVYVHLINGANYMIPLDIPARAALNTGIGLSFNGPGFSIDLNYKLDVRKEFMAHAAMADIKLSF